MKSVNLFDLIGKRVLVTRPTARSVEAELANALSGDHGAMVLDIAEVGGLMPSFFDEILSIIDERLNESSAAELQMTIKSPPTELSSKFLAVARAHGLTIEESKDGS